MSVSTRAFWGQEFEEVASLSEILRAHRNREVVFSGAIASIRKSRYSKALLW